MRSVELAFGTPEGSHQPGGELLAVVPLTDHVGGVGLGDQASHVQVTLGEGVQHPRQHLDDRNVGAQGPIEAGEFDANSKVVIIFPDHGSRYMSKVYSDQWMEAQGFFDSKNIGQARKIEYVK